MILNLKNLNNISFGKIISHLKNNNIIVESSIINEINFENFKSLYEANENDITFISKNNTLDSSKNIKAKACLVSKENSKYLPQTTKAIIVDNVYKSFALITNLFKHEMISNGIKSNSAVFADDIKFLENVQINHFVNILENCIFHNNVIIESNCTIGPNVIIGDNTVVKSNSTLSNCEVGSDCIIQSGAVIGGDGFGFDPSSKTKIQHFGNVLIKNNCNIGSNTTIDRSVFDSTVISENCFIDNLVQIAHNVFIGKGGIIASQTGIAGSTTIGDNVMIGGQAGISGHLKIGDNVTIAAKSGVTKNLKSNSVVAGFPAIDIAKWKIMNINLKKL